MSDVPEVDQLAFRIETLLTDGNITSKRMFGGYAFMLNGNMLLCASKKGLMVRVGADGEAKALESPHAFAATPSGRRMTGFVTVQPEGFKTESDLLDWINQARVYVETLPAK